MNLSFSEEQGMLKKMAGDFLERECPKSFVREMAEDEKGYIPELWRKIADLGWLGLVFPEEYGGGGGSFFDLIILLEEMGRACFPGPFFSTVVLGGLSILTAGNEEQKRELLPKVGSGDLILTLALTEPSASFEEAAISTQATIEGENYIINGTKLFVSDAHVADNIICVARTRGGITLFLVDAKSPGINCTLLRTLGWDKQCEVVFNNVKVPRGNILGGEDHGWEVVEKILEYAAVAKCAEMLGGNETVLEMSVNYAKERVQFGKPIGSFQAIQHHCANMLVDTDACKYITYEAAWMISEGIPATMIASMAKAKVSEASHRVTLLGHQIFGGLGFCMDNDIHLYYRRAKTGALAYGNAAFHQKKVAKELLG